MHSYPLLPGLLPILLALLPANTWAQHGEIRLIKEPIRAADMQRQEQLQADQAWQAFTTAHPGWHVEFNETSGTPHRAFGPGIPVSGTSPEQKAQAFISSELERFGVTPGDLVVHPPIKADLHTYLHYTQEMEGLPVIGGHVMVKLDSQQRVIAFGADVFTPTGTSAIPSVGAGAATASAMYGLEDVQSSDVQGLKWLPVPGLQDIRLVHEVVVTGGPDGHPYAYVCWVDAHSGELLRRVDRIVNHQHGPSMEEDAGADAQVDANVLADGPLQPEVTVGLGHLRVNIGGNYHYTDASGLLTSGITGPVSATLELRGRWSHVRTGTTTPSVTTTLQEGANTVNFNSAANVRQRTAYYAVNQVHDHVNAVLPGYTGMDFMLQTNVDVSGGDCNAYYDGASINFYPQANGCRSFATVPDVVYHEYGHGINDNYYSDMGSNFTNGAMNEGYADVWAFTITANPVLAHGYMLADPNSSIRRYDLAPKVYPVDLIGEVHSDGEIIAGAWWDLYRLSGHDMALTLALFAEAYPGLQAATFNGNEGVAYRDVLIDVLQADDDDGDITNGTPNGDVIVEAFALHGITLLSNVTFAHTPVEAAPATEQITIAANVAISFPFSNYLNGVRAFYRINNTGAWNSVLMTNAGGSSYTAQIPAQPIGTVVAYYLALEDINGQTSSVLPKGAAQAEPNLPYYILVGLDLEATEDVDAVNQLGTWTTGLPSDNATSGQWVQTIPMPSYGTFGDPSTMVQPGYQHTPGGDLCWVTGNAASSSSALGENDVDGGTTTVISGNIDLTGYTNPVFTYWRWYTNNPPSGANPNADWWQVYISNNGGTSWVPVEDTRTGDRSWRRHAFRVQDLLPPTATVRLKFHASDSIRPGQYLDGGSLVEAALDDVQLWDNVVDETSIDEHAEGRIGLYPDPARDMVNVELLPSQGRVRLDVLDLAGRVVLSPASGPGPVRFSIAHLAEGQYILRAISPEGSASRRFTVVH